MLVETLGDQAGRTAPWGIRANGDRGSQERVEPQRRAPSVVLWRRRDVLLKTALFIRGVAVKIRPPGESRIGGSADGGLVKQVARRTDFRPKLSGLAAVRAPTVRFVSIVRGRKRM